MPLLGRMIRQVAITGSADAVNGAMAGRQGGRWAEQTVRAAFPAAGHHPPGPVPATVPPAPRADPAEQIAALRALRDRGVVTADEFAALLAHPPG